MPPREGDGIRQQFLQLPRQDIEGCGFGRGRRPALLDPSIGHLPDLPVRTIPVSEVPACHPVGAAGGPTDSMSHRPPPPTKAMENLSAMVSSSAEADRQARRPRHPLSRSFASHSSGFAAKGVSFQASRGGSRSTNRTYSVKTKAGWDVWKSATERLAKAAFPWVT